MLNAFRRVISSGRYLPEIDGLRFIAIVSVVLFHIHVDLIKKSTITYSDSTKDYHSLMYVLFNGNRGVLLFFAISGFILALPFASHFLKGTKKIELKGYFLRRLTRLEPPYIITVIVLFLASAYLVRKVTIEQLMPSLLSSLFYVNNFFNINGSYPNINAVAWSLEIEVQFYILAPFLAYIFKLTANTRRTIMFLTILIFPILNIYLNFPFKSIYNYFHFFIIGFLLADLFVSSSSIKISKITAFFIGAILLAAIWIIPGEYLHHQQIQDIPHSYFLNYKMQVLYQLIFPLLILGFFYLVLFTRIWKRIMSIEIISIIGGMCYSIYLLHFAIISMIDRVTVKYKFTDSYVVDLLIQFIIISSIIGIICSLFFILVEKPFMVKDWHKKVRINLRNDLPRSN